MKRRTEIFVETERIIVMAGRFSRREEPQWCHSCDEGVDMLTTDHAAIVAHVTSRTIFRWAESGRLHTAETPEGLLLICPNSLPG